MASLTLQIEGMSCGHCLNAVRKSLGNLPGVHIGSVQIGRALLEYDPALIDPAKISAAVDQAGYHANVVPS